MKIEDLLKSYREQLQSEINAYNKLKWWQFKERKFRNEQIWWYKGFIEGIEMQKKNI